MPLVGPTPVSWIANQGAREDDQMRMMMQMALASRQYEQEQARLQQQATHQTELENIGWANAQSYDQSVNHPKPPQPTDLMQNFEFLRGQGYQGQDIPGMILPNLKENTGSQGYEYGIDSDTAGMIENDFKLPPGTVGRMGARQQADVNQQWLNRRFPRPDTNTPQGQTPMGLQVAQLQTLLQDYEGRRGAHITRMNNSLNGVLPTSPEYTSIKDAVQPGLDDVDSKITSIRGMLTRISGTGQPIPQSEWSAFNSQLSGAGGGYSQMAQEIAKEMGISPELADQYIKKAMGK